MDNDDQQLGRSGRHQNKREGKTLTMWKQRERVDEGEGRQLVFKGNVSILKVVVEEAVGIFHVSTSDPHRLV